MARTIRFGHQLRTSEAADPITAAQRAEAIGFDVVLVPDHVGAGLAPMPTLAAIAAATSTIRLGTFVLNSDMRNPVQLAWEAGTIDRLSAGRFELGLGAGHTPHEYAEVGLPMAPPAARKSALAERVEIIRRLLDGETVTIDGAHHRLDGARIDASRQQRLPILVGANGAAALAHAGAHADIIGLQGLGRTKDDGHQHEVAWSTEHLDEQIEQVRAGAGERFDAIELNALVQVVDITDEREHSLERLGERLDRSASPEALAEIPYVLIGTVDEIAAKVLRCRERWGVSYFVVRDLDEFAPVIDAVRILDV
jgi:probable F420-dependent oxidoreductase